MRKKCFKQSCCTCKTLSRILSGQEVAARQTQLLLLLLLFFWLPSTLSALHFLQQHLYLLALLNPALTLSIQQKLSSLSCTICLQMMHQTEVEIKFCDRCPFFQAQ
jgi:hypothetical protein